MSLDRFLAWVANSEQLRLVIEKRGPIANQATAGGQLVRSFVLRTRLHWLLANLIVRLRICMCTLLLGTAAPSLCSTQCLARCKQAASARQRICSLKRQEPSDNSCTNQRGGCCCCCALLRAAAAAAAADGYLDEGKRSVSALSQDGTRRRSESKSDPDILSEPGAGYGIRYPYRPSCLPVSLPACRPAVQSRVHAHATSHIPADLATVPTVMQFAADQHAF